MENDPTYNLWSNLWCVPRVKVRVCWRDRHMMKESAAPITAWCEQQTLDKAACQCHGFRWCRQHRQAHELFLTVRVTKITRRVRARAVKTREDKSERASIRFVYLRDVSILGYSGHLRLTIVYAWLFRPSWLFATANITSQTFCIIPYLFMHWVGDAHRKVEGKFLCTATYCLTIYYLIHCYGRRNPSQWSRFDAIWSPGISDLEPWLASLSAELVGRIREVGTSVDSQRGRSAWNQVTVKWYNSFPARIQHGNHGVWSYTIVVVLIRTGIMCYWLRE